MGLALFDLDHTLIAGDSDYLWGQFLCEQKIVDASEYERENQRFYDDYRRGELDILAFLAFSLRPLKENGLSDLAAWREQFMVEKIGPRILEQAKALVEKHRTRGDTLVIITATNRFVTEPIAKLFGVEHLIASEPEMIGGRYTGKVAGTPSFAEGKVTRLEEWLPTIKLELEDSFFYSDSHNDLPLLNLVDHPIAVNPDEKLRVIANERGWEILELYR